MVFVVSAKSTYPHPCLFFVVLQNAITNSEVTIMHTHSMRSLREMAACIIFYHGRVVSCAW